MDEPFTPTQTRLILPAICWNRYRADFYAVTADLSVTGLRFRSSVVPSPGEALSCSIRHAGSLEALVIEGGKEHFVTRVIRADAPLPVIVRRLLDLASEQNGGEVPQRVHPRFVPDQPDILVTMPCGTRIPGRLINVSASGAALRIDLPLEPGTRITLGQTPATVARCFKDGIGAAFLHSLPAGELGPHVSL
ncbi:PilZ domain-containing protein [Methylobacterium sp. M6A4_1b]